MPLDLSSSEKTSKTLIHKPFPYEGKVRAKRIAEFLGIGVSTYWSYVACGRIKPPERYGKRVSVWDAEYIRELAKNGIPKT